MKHLKKFEEIATRHTKPDIALADVLISIDDFTVECEIDNKIRTLKEYRILVEPDSKEEKRLLDVLYGS